MNEQDKRVRDYYQNMSMSQEKLDQLLKATSHAESSTETDQESESFSIVQYLLPKRQWLAWASAGLVCGLVLTVALWVHSPGSERTEHTIREVALNHTTRLEPEFRGSSLANLDNSMHQLPFALTLPQSIAGKYELIGSRYCSLSGVLAAHVKLHDKSTGKAMSLFVASNTAELEEIRPQQTSLDGVEVEFWREGGLFYALAKRS